MNTFYKIKLKYTLFIERKKKRSKSLVLEPGARKNLLVIKSYTRTVFRHIQDLNKAKT